VPDLQWLRRSPAHRHCIRSRGIAFQDRALTVGTTLSSPARFQTRGVDAGYFNWGVLQVKNVVFQ
jgi:hypothetical protein